MTSQMSLLKEIEARAIACIRESSPSAINQLSGLCEQLSPSDFCFPSLLSSDNSGFLSRKYPMMYAIHESELMTMALFVLPKGSILPLHDHPNMHVLTKLLYGDISIVGFDKGRMVADGIFETQEKINLRWTENDDWSIHSTGPDDKNIHEIIAHSPSAFFDILTPPYGDNHNITYYSLLRSERDFFLRGLDAPPPWFVCGGEKLPLP